MPGDLCRGDRDEPRPSARAPVYNLATRFTSSAAFIRALVPFVQDETLFLPAKLGLSVGELIRFRILLRDGSVGHAGIGQVCGAQERSGGSGHAIGTHLRVREVDPSTRPLHDALMARWRGSGAGTSAASERSAGESPLVDTLLGPPPISIGPGPSATSQRVPRPRAGVRTPPGARSSRLVVVDGPRRLGADQELDDPFAEVSSVSIGLLVEETLAEVTVEMPLPDPGAFEQDHGDPGTLATLPDAAPPRADPEPLTSPTPAPDAGWGGVFETRGPGPDASSVPDQDLLQEQDLAGGGHVRAWIGRLRTLSPGAVAAALIAVVGPSIVVLIWPRAEPGAMASSIKPAPPATPPAPAVARHGLADGRSPSPAATSCTAHIDSSPRGATVVIGSRTLGTTPLQVGVPCGETSIRIVRARYLPRTETLLASPDEPARLSTRLIRPRAKLHLSSLPAGAVFRVDGNPVGRAPQTVSVSRFETIRVDASLDGQSWERRLYVRGESVKIGAVLATPPSNAHGSPTRKRR